jgi:hypothetical protein
MEKGVAGPCKNFGIEAPIVGGKEGDFSVLILEIWQIV